MISPSDRLKLIGLVAFLPCVVFYLHIQDDKTRHSILISAIVSCAGYFLTRATVPLVARFTLKAGLFGLDINKKGSKEGEKKIPESLGLASGVIFLVCIILFQQLHYYDATSFIHHLTGTTPSPTSSWLSRLFSSPPSSSSTTTASHHVTDAWLVDYNAALATICFMLFLGFADDVLDIPWRVKLILPCLASLPLMIAYSGGTGIVIPKPIRSLLALQFSYIELGLFYKLYMIALVIFCANSINILAGVNGLEAGQTLLISSAVLCHNLLELRGSLVTKGSTYTNNSSSRIKMAEELARRDGHLFSAYLMLPLAATTAALLTFNWYPAKVFVGDTFTYFAGMTLAVAGILGHFSETLLLFLLPQVFNFVYSLPQLFKIVPCPRHRLPKYDPATGLLHATPNYNLVNLMLRITGPSTESQLCFRLLMLQVVSCVAAFAVRHLLTGIYK